LLLGISLIKGRNTGPPDSISSSPEKWEKVAVDSPFREMGTKGVQFVEPKNKRGDIFR
jgi:hypothetical protein